MNTSNPIWLPKQLSSSGFNPEAKIPYGCTTESIKLAMESFLDFLTFINKQLVSREMERLESFLMPANFSSMVGEFMASTIPNHCATIVKNKYHNGHPDLVPVGMFPGDAILHAKEGIEIKASRHNSGWQGHNAENVWLMVFVFDSNTAADSYAGNPNKPFRFLAVYGAQLELEDWNFSGRSATSRRTITASINKNGFAKLSSNWIYKDPVKAGVPEMDLKEMANLPVQE